MSAIELRAQPGDAPVFGIAELDAADRRMLALVRNLNQAIAAGADAAQLQRLMQRILREALDHFACEERILYRSGYPQRLGHAALHLQMKAELEYALEQFGSAETRAAWAEYGRLVEQLFVEHMRQEAVKFQRFLHAGVPAGTPLARL